jgi:hypothetical protein
MDPYLEPFWGDVHSSLVLYVRNQLQGVLPRDLRARVQERVFVDNPPVWGCNVGSEPVTETFIEIIDIRSGRQVVTVIEVLSPANKRPGNGQDLYKKKQGEVISGKMSLVEIDLLRAGQSVLSVDSRHLPHRFARMPYMYRVVVRRGWKPSQAEFYAVPLRERLPAIRVPLRETDSDVPLDLQAILDHTYDNGGYQDDLDYEAEADPPLQADDIAWADTLLRETGQRRRPAVPRSRRRTRPKDS